MTGNEMKPCCPGAAAREIVQISVAGTMVGIAQLEHIISKVSAMSLDDEIAIGKALMKEVRVFNYVPSARDKDYLGPILLEYHKRRI